VAADRDVGADLEVGPAQLVFDLLVDSQSATADATGLSVIDTWHTGPRNPTERSRWRQETQKIKTQRGTYRFAAVVTGLGALLPLAGIAMRLCGEKVALTTAGTNWLVALALLLSLAAIGRGATRVRHPPW
jgi:hypothetical protein